MGFPNPFGFLKRQEPILEQPPGQTLGIIQQQSGGPPPTETARLVLDHEGIPKDIRKRFYYADPLQAATSNIINPSEKRRRMDAFGIRQDIRFNNAPKYQVLVGKKMDVILEKNLSLDYALLLDDSYSKGLFNEGSRMVTSSSNRTEIQNTQQMPFMPMQQQKKGLFGFLGL
jgi:hypothetical protein